MSELISFSFRFAVIGIVIVFGSLALITLVVSIIRRVDDGWQKREETRDRVATQKTPTIDNITLVLISAAVATMFQGRAYIRKVRRLLPRDAASSPWSSQGRAVLHGSHISRRGR
ncbi:MAG: OadG family protein [Candidatus Zixiibacteriota bacterium]